MPFKIASYGPEAEPFRTNDGALIIVNYCADEDDTVPVMHVLRFLPVKSREKHSAPDPVQSAFAKRAVALLNGDLLGASEASAEYDAAVKAHVR